MSQLFKRAALCFALLAVIVYAIGAWLPSTFNVSRERTISVPLKRVSDVLVDLSKWAPWDPWQNSETDLKLEISRNARGLWVGRWLKDGIEHGRVIQQPQLSKNTIEYNLERSGEPLRRLRFELQDLGMNTRVRWTVSGKNKFYPIGNIFAVQMEKYVGPVYERGLDNLKKHLEK